MRKSNDKAPASRANKENGPLHPDKYPEEPLMGHCFDCNRYHEAFWGERRPDHCQRELDLIYDLEQAELRY